MRVLLQRVSRAAVRVEGREVGAIGPGLLALVGVARTDAEPDAVRLADKTVDLRIFPDADGRMNRSVLEIGGGVLVVSQFTLLASTHRGNRPSYADAAAPGLAEALYERYAARIADRGVPVRTGIFRAMMEVELTNDGPVTIHLDSAAP